MRISRLVPAMLGLLAALPAGLSAATPSERGNHFEAIIALSDAKIHATAKRQLDAYLAAGYDDPGSNYQNMVQWYFYDSFSLEVAANLADSYTKQAANFEQRLRAAGDDLPAELASYFQASGKIQKIAKKVSADFVRPDSPPPLVNMTDQEVRGLETIVQQLLDATDTVLADQAAKIKAHAPEVEKTYSMEEGPAYWKIIQEATMLRYAYMETLYQTYKPLREIILRKDIATHRISPELVAKAQGWLMSKLGKEEQSQELSDWDYNYGDFYPLLRHRLSVMKGEVLRLGKVAGANTGAFSVEETKDAFYSVLDLDLSPYDRNTAKGLERLKYVTWSDLLYWHLLMGDSTSLDQAAKLWTDLEERAAGDKEFRAESRDEIKGILWGHLHILRARIADGAGDGTAANGYLATVQSSPNPFAVNAKNWIAYFAKGAGGASGGTWSKQPSPMNPEQALTVAKALIGNAGKMVEADQVNNLYEQAAAALRDGVLGLPNPKDPSFAEQAPEIYYWLSYALYKRGWVDRAAVVAHAGLDRFQPDLWGEKPSNKNPWFPRGRLSKAGTMVRQLSQYALVYSQAYYSRTRSAGANELFESAINKQGKFDPEAVQGNRDVLQIMLLLEQEEYERAGKLAVGYYRKKKKEADGAKDSAKKFTALVDSLKGLTLATRAQNSLWLELVEQNISQDSIKEASDQLEKMTGALNKFAQVGLSEKSPIPADYRGEFRSAYQLVLSIQIGQLMKQERFADVVAALDAEFWASAPRDEAMVRSFLRYLSGAAYQLNLGEAKKLKELKLDDAKVVIEASVQPFLAQWPAYRQAYSTFSEMIKRYPALDVQAPDIRKRLAGLYNITGQVVAQRVSSNVDALGQDAGGMLRRWIRAALPLNEAGVLTADKWPGSAESFAAIADGADEISGDALDSDAVLGGWLKAADPSLAAAADLSANGTISGDELDSAAATTGVAKAMERMAKSRFADLYEVLIDDDEKPNMVLAVANTLWELDEKTRAARLFEMYQDKVLGNPKIAEFQDDPQPTIDALRPLVAARQELKGAWERIHPAHPNNSGSIPDLLLDEPGFDQQHYLNANSRRSDWPEQKADYFKALRAIREFRKEFDALSGLIPNYEEGNAALDEFENLVRDLAYRIQIDSQLIEAYREAGDINRAVEKATKLYEYDPLDPVFMVTMVEGTLDGLRKGAALPKETIEQARKIAAELRNQSKREADMRNYWIASIQVLELSVFMEDFKTLNSILSSQVARKILPVQDLYAPAGPDFDPAVIPDGYAVYRKVAAVEREDGAVDFEPQLVGTFNRGALQVITRYIQLFSVEGVQVGQPLREFELDVPHPNGGTVMTPAIEIIESKEK